MIVCLLSKGGEVRLGQAGRGGTIHNHSNKYQTVSNMLKQWGGYLYFGVVTRMDDDSKLVVCKIDEVWTGRRAL